MKPTFWKPTYVCKVCDITFLTRQAQTKHVRESGHQNFAIVDRLWDRPKERVGVAATN